MRDEGQEGNAQVPIEGQHGSVFPLDSPNHQSQGRSEAPRHMKRPLWMLLVLSVYLAVFLFALDITIVADAQPRILEDLGEVEKLPWITVAFRLGATSLLLLWYSSDNSCKRPH